MGFPRLAAEEPVRACWWGLWGSQQCNTGPSPLFKQQGRLLAELTLKETRWRACGKREEQLPVFGIYSQSPLRVHCIMETYSCSSRPAVSRSSPCISQISVEPFITSHAKNTYKSQVKTLLEYKTFSFGFAETQLIHTLIIILEAAKIPVQTVLRQTQDNTEAEVLKGVFTICTRGRVLLSQHQQNAPLASSPWSFTLTCSTNPTYPSRKNQT